MTHSKTLSASLSITLFSACLVGLAGTLGCSSQADVPESVVVTPWARSFGGNGTSSQVTAITAGASGNIAVAGTFQGDSIDLGGGPLASTADPNLFLAKLDTEGKHIWSGRTGGGDDFATGIALDRGGSALVAGTFNGFIDFGSGGELNGSADVFLARFGASGDPLWSKEFTGGPSSDTVSDIKVDRSGGIYLMGNANGDINFGLGAVLPGQFANLYVAKLNSAGGTVFSIGFESFNYCNGRKIATDAEGNSIIFGEFYGAINFGGGDIATGDSYGIFLLKLDANGHHVWSKGFSSAVSPEGFGSASAVDVATDPDGNILLTGVFGGQIDFGGGLLDSQQSYNSIFLVSLGPDGKHRFSKAFGAGDLGYQQVTGVAADAAGNVFIAGTFEPSIDFGGGAITSQSQDIFLAKFDANGKTLSSKSIGNEGYETLSAFTVTTGGNPVMAGSFSGTLDLGSSSLTAPDGSQETFIAALAP